MRKSVISLLLSISMIVGSIGAVPAFAAEAVEEETASSTGSAEEAVKEMNIDGKIDFQNRFV